MIRTYYQHELAKSYLIEGDSIPIAFASKIKIEIGIA